MPTFTSLDGFNETPVGVRRLVLILYGLVGPVFSVALLGLGGLDHPRHVLAVVLLIATGAAWTALRTRPTVDDFLFPAAISPTLCCGIAFAATGAHGSAYLGVMGAPLAWSAVLFDRRVALAAWLTAVGTCFVVVSSEAGVPAGALNTAVLATIYALVGWVVNGLAMQLRRTRAELQDQTARDAALLKAIPDTLVIVDHDGRFVDVQSPPGDELPAARAELIGQPAFNWMEPEAARRLREALTSALSTEHLVVVEYEAVYREEHRTFEARIARSGLDRAVVIRRDVTSRRAAELALKESEERLALALEGSGAGTFDWDVSTGVVKRSDACAVMLGYTTDELGVSPEDWSQRLHPDDHARALEARDAHLAGRTDVFDVDYRMRAKDGAWRWVRSRGRVTERDASGRPLRLVGTVTTVDAHHHEQEHRLDEARLRGLENRVNEIELVMRIDGRLVEANDKALAAYGYSREEMRALGIQDLRAPVTRADVHPRLERLLSEPGMQFETQHCRRDGTTFPVSVSSRAFTVGAERYIHSLVRDLTEERRAHAERAFYAGLTRRMRDAVIVTDVESRVVAYTGAAQAIYGLPEAEVLGREVGAVLTHVAPPEELARHHAELAAGKPSRLQTRARRPDGTWIDLDVMVDVLCDEAGVVTGQFSVSRDITALKAVEATLQAALGERETLLKEMHHRVKNNLQMMVSLFALEAAAVKDPEAAAALLDSQERLRSMALIHEQLYQAPDLARIDFGSFVEVVVSGLGTVFGARPGVAFDVNVGDVWLGVDTAIPCALIVNELVSNALKYAFPDGRDGRIEVTLQALAAPGHFALSVADDGVGLPPGFDPEASATLGIQLVNILARQLRGHLTIDRARGTRFELVWTARREPAS